MTDQIRPKLGCLPPVNKPALVLSDFFTGVLPATPPVDYLGYRRLWPWWLNNLKGTCVAATWAAIKALVSYFLAGKEVILTDAEIVAIYKTQNPNYPAQDGGMDIQTLLEYLQKKGEIVAFGTADRLKHAAAISIFGFVWTSITVRSASFDDYNAGRDWDYHPASPIEGYHSVMSAGHRDTAADDVRFETWTKEQGFTGAFWGHEVGQTWVVILPEHLQSKEFMAAMDLPALADAFQTLTGRVLPLPPTPYSRSAVNYTAIEPVRVLDTRTNVGLSGPFHTGVARTLKIAGVAGIPANAVAIAGNLTVTQQTQGGYLAIGPTPHNAPTTSTLNFPVHDDRANCITGTGLATDGSVSITYISIAGATAHAILDVTGYYS